MAQLRRILVLIVLILVVSYILDYDIGGIFSFASEKKEQPKTKNNNSSDNKNVARYENTTYPANTYAGYGAKDPHTGRFNPMKYDGQCAYGQAEGGEMRSIDQGLRNADKITTNIRDSVGLNTVGVSSNAFDARTHDYSYNIQDLPCNDPRQCGFQGQSGPPTVNTMFHKNSKDNPHGVQLPMDRGHYHNQLTDTQTLNYEDNLNNAILDENRQNEFGTDNRKQPSPPKDNYPTAQHASADIGEGTNTNRLFITRDFNTRQHIMSKNDYEPYDAGKADYDII